MIVLTQRDIVELLTMDDCIDVMANALAGLARGESLVPLRTMMVLPTRDPKGAGAEAAADGGRFGNQKDIFALMPAFVGGQSYDPWPPAIGAKVISVFPGNHGTALDSHQGAVLLFNASNGSLEAVLDATAITSIRTAAVSALATKLLARVDADDLAIIGSGVQARMHLEAIPLIRKIDRVRIWSRNKDNARRLRDRFAPAAEVLDSVEETVRGASIVCVATSATEPVLRGEWVAPGAHVNVVGAATPAAREVDSALVKRSRLFVDSRVGALNEAGDVLIPIHEGEITPDHIVAELGEIVAGIRVGRRTSAEITLFKSLGLAVEDIAAAVFVHGRAEQRGTGIMIDLGGVRDDG
jgi:ornithine cyclodeaminase/alanine dehydrogenase-like protein (mu-crystallin family)